MTCGLPKPRHVCGCLVSLHVCMHLSLSLSSLSLSHLSLSHLSLSLISLSSLSHLSHLSLSLSLSLSHLSLTHTVAALEAAAAKESEHGRTALADFMAEFFASGSGFRVQGSGFRGEGLVEGLCKGEQARTHRFRQRSASTDT